MRPWTEIAREALGGALELAERWGPSVATVAVVGFMLWAFAVCR